MSHLQRALQRTFFAFMRTVKPVLHLKDMAWVFRDEDVREILSRDAEFTLRQVNAEKVERRIGPFLLSLDDGPQYQHEAGVMRSIVKREDADRVRRFIRETATSISLGLAQKGAFDVVSAFTRIVPLRMLEDYFGTPGPNDGTMMHWNRSLFWDIFLNLKDETGPTQAGKASAAGLNTYLDQVIAQTHAEIADGGGVRDHLISRLVLLQNSDAASLDDDGIRRNIAGALLGAAEPIAKACVNILNQFFHRPDILKQAQAAATADDIDQISKLAFEAYRFHPNLPVIIRYAEKDQLMSSGRKIRAGKKVYAFILSAMFDKRKFPHPNQFQADRPFSDYLYFGHGLHACFGTYINRVAIPEMLMALLKIEGLKPASGKAGKIQYEGTFPDKWILRCTHDSH